MKACFTMSVRTAIAALLLSTCPAQSVSGALLAPQNCSNPTPVGTANPNSDSALNTGAGLAGNYIFSDRPGPNCYPRAKGYICPRSNDARSSATGQRTTCQGTICTYPCPNGDGYCNYDCPPRGTQDGPERGQSDPSRGNDGNRGGGGGGILPWLIIGGVALAGAAVAADQMTGDWANSAELDARGPRFPLQQITGRFQVQAYAASNWPFALDLYTEPGTRTWLEVRFKGDKRPQSVDLTRPEGGRRMAFVQLPAASAGIRVARYSIHSVLERPGQEPVDRPMKIYGIGAGPGAVGVLESANTLVGPGGARRLIADRAGFAAPSLPFLQAASAAAARLGGWVGALGMAAVVQPSPRFGSYLAVTTFGPQYPSRPGEVNWSVAALQPFQRSELDVLQLPSDGNGKLIAVVRADLDLFARTRASGSWGGMPVLASVGPGTYQLQARAWRPKAGGGDWTGAFASDYVYIR